MKCHACGSQGRLISFNSFSYHYCDGCRVECSAGVATRHPAEVGPGDVCRILTDSPCMSGLFAGDLVTIVRFSPFSGEWQVADMAGTAWFLMRDNFEPMVLEEPTRAMSAAIRAVQRC